MWGEGMSGKANRSGEAKEMREERVQHWWGPEARTYGGRLCKEGLGDRVTPKSEKLLYDEENRILRYVRPNFNPIYGIPSLLEP